MNIDCYLFEGCGAEQDLRKNIQALTVEKMRAEINFNVIDDTKAIALGLTGSPRYLSMVRRYSHKERRGSHEGCSVMSLEGSPMNSRWRQLGWQSENTNICNHSYTVISYTKQSAIALLHQMKEEVSVR